ncbi:MAG TPA: thioredoxin domain-containing protein [Gemmatimonadales bacterium]|jgi:protein-disulfide isomerase|nr:thioredoxin domain-containing protein [Gemmatimonadales bacterium]
MAGLLIPVTARDHCRGPAEASLVLVQYADFQCPHCALLHPIVDEIRRELKDSLRVVFRHFPLSQVHPRAKAAALAAEAADSQGKFWDMADLLHDNHEELDQDSLERYAKKLKLSMKQFSGEIESGAHEARIRADFLGGVRSGVNGTPTFFINGQRHEGSLTFDAMVTALLNASRSK